MLLKEFTWPVILRRAFNVEQGYVNNPNDRGGPTKCGVTLATANEYKADLIKLFNWNGNIKDLTVEMATYIYRVGWWERICGDQLLAIHPFIADRIFDLGINGGRALAIKNLQRILNVLNRQQKDYADIAVDGGITPTGSTMRALQAFTAKRGRDGLDNIIELLFALQGAHYVTISEGRLANEEFTNGWATRVHDARMYYNSYTDAW